MPYDSGGVIRDNSYGRKKQSVGLYCPKFHSIAINGENLERKASVVKKVSENKFDLSNCLYSKISQCL